MTEKAQPTSPRANKKKGKKDAVTAAAGGSLGAAPTGEKDHHPSALSISGAASAPAISSVSAEAFRFDADSMGPPPPSAAPVSTSTDTKQFEHMFGYFQGSIFSSASELYKSAGLKAIAVVRDTRVRHSFPDDTKRQMDAINKLTKVNLELEGAKNSTPAGTAHWVGKIAEARASILGFDDWAAEHFVPVVKALDEILASNKKTVTSHIRQFSAKKTTVSQATLDGIVASVCRANSADTNRASSAGFDGLSSRREKAVKRAS